MIWFKWTCDNKGREIVAYNRNPSRCPLKLPVINCEKINDDTPLKMI